LDQNILKQKDVDQNLYTYLRHDIKESFSTTIISKSQVFDRYLSELDLEILKQ